jgi:hypothetical protein
VIQARETQDRNLQVIGEQQRQNQMIVAGAIVRQGFD